MRKITLIFPLFAFMVFTLSITPLKSQILFNNGALVHVDTTTTMQVNGGFQNDNLIGGPGTWINDGDMTITSNGSTPGNIYISNNAVLQGNGTYHLDQDWINDAVFIANNSTVDMFGNLEELITSTTDTITTFDTLILSGTGTGMNRRKQQTLDANVAGALLLNNRVLFTAGHTMFITTPNPAAVTNDTTYLSEGFVSSVGAGSLSRVTNSNSPYYFPVGADSAVLRYRKVLLTPASASPNTYSVRLADNNATNDGYNIGLFDTSSLCRINPLFYHRISHSAGSDSTDIDIFYDTNADGGWNKIAQWNTPAANLWNNSGVVTNRTAFPYSDVLKKKWADFSNLPFILGATKPAALIYGKTTICTGENVTLKGAGGPGYLWSTGSTADSITVSPPVTTTYTLHAGNGLCSADTTITINVAPPPPPYICCDSVISNGENVQLISSGGQSYLWSPSAGLNCDTCPNPIAAPAQTTTYTLTAANDSGCVAQGFVTVTIENPCGNIFVPNAFSPNEPAGHNNILYVRGGCTYSIDFIIFDRWGNKVFESENINDGWDGKYGGSPMNTGTYVWYLNAVLLDGTVVERKGNVALIR